MSKSHRLTTGAVVALVAGACLMIRGPQEARGEDAVPVAAEGVDLLKRAEEVKNLTFSMFVCWSLSSFSDQEWTSGSTPISTFNPTGCDTDQWARTAKAAGMTMIVFLTKHHDGFCLWDTKTTDRKVTRSPLGKDVLAELRKSCDTYGLKLGLYYSEGDWTWPGAVDGNRSGGKNPEMKKAQLRELLTQYGVIEYMFLDIAASDGGLSTRETNAYIKNIQPGCLVSSSPGETEMEDRNNKPAGPPTPGFPNTLLCDVSQTLLARDDRWFYTNPGRDNEVRPAEEIFALYQDCVKHRNLLLLDVGPDRSGRLRKIDVETLEKIGKMIRQ